MCLKTSLCLVWSFAFNALPLLTFHLRATATTVALTQGEGKRDRLASWSLPLLAYSCPFVKVEGPDSVEGAAAELAGEDHTVGEVSDRGCGGAMLLMHTQTWLPLTNLATITPKVHTINIFVTESYSRWINMNKKICIQHRANSLNKLLKYDCYLTCLFTSNGCRRELSWLEEWEVAWPPPLL